MYILVYLAKYKIKGYNLHFNPQKLDIVLKDNKQINQNDCLDVFKATI